MLYYFNGYSLELFKVHSETDTQLKVIPVEGTGHIRVRAINKTSLNKTDVHGGIWTADVEHLTKHLADQKIKTTEAHARRIKKIDEIIEELNHGKT